ncbi:MAG: hypothetical protein M3347_12755 [Armatimonadota bacterium]|nr:hypothetical protein [Armatimonadota bacterium]
MSQTLTLEIPDELYRALIDLAEQQGRSAEDLGATWLAATIERIAGDPLMQLAGTLQPAVSDLAERHDEYIGQHLMAELRDDEE